MTTHTEKKIGLFSATAAPVYGSNFWRTPDDREVEITTTCTAETRAQYKFPDAVEVGEVVEWVRHGQPRRDGWGER